ncbi:hypothetical protein RI367_007963 [Sorochytrium milnesiophthora]
MAGTTRTLSYLLTASTWQPDLAMLSQTRDMCQAIDRDQLFASLGATEGVSQMLQKWTVRINDLLQDKSPISRACGLQLLSLLIDQQPVVLPKYAIGWLQGCLHIMSAVKTLPAGMTEQAVAILVKLLTETSRVPELHREIVSTYVPKAFNALLSAADYQDDAVQTTSLSGLLSLTRAFPAQARYSNDKITATCLSTALGAHRSHTSPVVPVAAELLCALCACSSKSNPAEVWRTNVERIMGTITQTLDVLFRSTDEDTAMLLQFPSFEGLAEIKPDNGPLTQYSQLISRLLSLYQLLQAHMSADITTPVSFPTRAIITLLCRVFNVNTSAVALADQDRDEFTVLMMLLPDIHTASLSLLSCVVDCLRARLVPYTRMLCTVVAQMAKESYATAALLKLAPKLLITMGIMFFGDVQEHLVRLALQALTPSTFAAASSPALALRHGKQNKQRQQIQLTAAGPSNALLSMSEVPLMEDLCAVLCVLFTQYGAAMDTSNRAQLDSVLLLHANYGLAPSCSRPPSQQMAVLEALVCSALAPSCVHIRDAIQPYSIVEQVMHLLGRYTAGSDLQTQLAARRHLASLSALTHPRITPTTRPCFTIFDAAPQRSSSTTPADDISDTGESDREETEDDMEVDQPQNPTITVEAETQTVMLPLFAPAVVTVATSTNGNVSPTSPVRIASSPTAPSPAPTAVTIVLDAEESAPPTNAVSSRRSAPAKRPPPELPASTSSLAQRRSSRMSQQSATTTPRVPSKRSAKSTPAASTSTPAAAIRTIVEVHVPIIVPHRAQAPETSQLPLKRGPGRPRKISLQSMSSPALPKAVPETTRRPSRTQEPAPPSPKRQKRDTDDPEETESETEQSAVTTKEQANGASDDDDDLDLDKVALATLVDEGPDE